MDKHKIWDSLVKWYRTAADQGNAMAQRNRSLMYDRGHRVPRDYAEAVKRYRKAADQGDADAQSSLGLTYYHGNGVPQDYAEAMKWYRKEEQGVKRNRGSVLAL